MSLRIDRLQLDIIINGDQSRVRLRELEDQAAKLKRELKKLPEASDEYVRKSADLRKVQAEMDGIIDKIGILGLTSKELAARQRDLNAIMKHMDPRTSQYKELETQLKQVTGRLTELRTGAKATGLSFQGIADGFNRYFGVIAAFTASFTGIIIGFRKVVDTFNQFEERVDNLSALTGLAGADLAYLSDEAKKMSVSMVEGNIRITQSASAIVDAYTKVGSARPELLKNKEDLASVTQEAMILAAAAKSELQPAVDSLTGVLNQFNAPASESRRIINAIAAGSKAGAGEIPYLTAAIEKSGTIAADAGMSIEELVGTIETLAPRMKEPEMAGRNLKAIILKLQEGADDTNPSIVGFAQAIENLGKKNLSATELTKLFGLENITAAKILINNVGEMKNYTAAVTGTNVALEQAAINTDNNSAKLAQAKNRMELTAIALGEKLAPALTFSTNGFSYLMRAVLAIINVFKDYGGFILSAAAGIAVYTIAINLNTIATKAYTLYTNLATKATAMFNSVTKINPYALIAAAITTAVLALIAYSKQLTATEKTQRMLNDLSTDAKKNVASERVEIERLLSVARDEKRSKEDRAAAIKKLNELSPEYLGNLSLENINTTAAKDATEKYIEVLEKKARVQAAQEKLVEIEKQFIDLREQGIGSEVKWYQLIWNSVKAAGNATQAAVYNAKSQIKNYSSAFDELALKKKALLGILDEKTDSPNSSSPTSNNSNLDGNTPASSNSDEYKKLLAEQQKYIDELILKTKSLTEQENIAYQERLKKAGLFEADRKKLTANQLTALQYLEKEHFDNISNITLEFSADQKVEAEKRKKDMLKTAEETNHVVFDLLKQRYIADLEAAGTNVKAREAIESKYRQDVLTAEMGQLLARKALLLGFGMDTTAIEQAIADKKLQIIQETFNAQKSINDEAKTQLQTWLEDNDKYLQAYQQMLGDLSSAASGFREAEEIEAQTASDKELKDLEDKRSRKLISEANYAKQKELLEDKSKKKQLEIQKKYAGKEFALKTLTIIADTAVAIMKSFAQLGPIAGTVAAIALGITGGAQLAVAHANYQKVNQLEKGRIPVVGADDGKTYNVPYAGKAKTGIYPRPVLISERGGEMVVDAETTSDLVVNYPGIVQFIKGLSGKRTRQYADGNYPDYAPISRPQENDTMVMTVAALAQTIGVLNSKLDNLKATMVMDQFKEVETDYNAIKADVSKG